MKKMLNVCRKVDDYQTKVLKRVMDKWCKHTKTNGPRCLSPPHRFTLLTLLICRIAEWLNLPSLSSCIFRMLGKIDHETAKLRNEISNLSAKVSEVVDRYHLSTFLWCHVSIHIIQSFSIPFTSLTPTHPHFIHSYTLFLFPSSTDRDEAVASLLAERALNRELTAINSELRANISELGRYSSPWRTFHLSHRSLITDRWSLIIYAWSLLHYDYRKYLTHSYDDFPPQLVLFLIHITPTPTPSSLLGAKLWGIVRLLNCLTVPSFSYIYHPHPHTR